MKNYESLLESAMGSKKSALVLKNGKIINVFTGEILSGDIAVEDGYIAGIGTYEGEKEIDLEGRYVAPGFIDAHLHLESTMVTPPELIENAVAWGTTTYVVDPHEAANVKGKDGIDYILHTTAHVPANVYVMMPSCVPATAFEDNGCVFRAEDMKEYLDNPRILGLGEVMDYVSVVNGAPDMVEKLNLFRHKTIDGHAPGLSEKDLNTYALAGIQTDHECVDYEYAMRERRLGMHVHIREGSAARNLEALVKGIVENKVSTEGFSFCTDDKHIEDIRREGHISYCIKKAVALGIPPVQAIRMATIQAARCYKLDHLGAVAPGYQADLVILQDLEELKITDVYYKGAPVREYKIEKQALAAEHPLKNTVHLKEIRPEDLTYRPGEAPHAAVQLLPGQIVTKKFYGNLPCEEGCFKQNAEYNKLAVLERHHATGKIGIGAVIGFGIRDGAIASSVSHDSHNISVIGDNDEDMLLAVRELERVQGGYTIVSRGKVLDTLPLPIMGLMSDAGFEQVNELLQRMTKTAHEMGVPKGVEPFVTMSFIALPVIPEIRVTPRGLFDVTVFSFVK